MAASLAAIHPHELSYFNEVAGGPIGGRHALSDSNLDWGQGALDLARLQQARPEFRDLTLFAFGETDPDHYGVVGRRVVFDANRTPAGLPASLTVETPYLAVSASLQFGPLGAGGLLPSTRRGRAGGLHRRHDHRRLSDCGSPLSVGPSQKRSRPRVRRSSRLSATSAIRPTRRATSTRSVSSTARFWITTKYSSPRSVLIAKWPSTTRALSLSRIRGSRSFAVPQIETRETIGRPPGSRPGVAEIDGLLAIELERDDHPPAVAGGRCLVAGPGDEVADQPVRVGGRPARGLRKGRGRRGPRRRRPRPPRGAGRSRCRTGSSRGWPSCSGRRRSGSSAWPRRASGRWKGDLPPHLPSRVMDSIRVSKAFEAARTVLSGPVSLK